MREKYRPSNGTEGMWFEDKFCMQCIHCHPHPDKKPQCNILLAAFCYDLKDEKYPKEWVYDENGKPTCTSWKKWDWGNDPDWNDPNDPDNPNAPIPISPNQLVLPFELEAIENNVIKPELV